jgi:hypothetical protein
MFKPNCTLVLYRRSVCADGSLEYDQGSPFYGFFMERQRSSAEGTEEDFSELLMPAESAPLPGDQIEINGLKRNIAQVRHCTGADGTLRCYRCYFMRE